jgi:uncharacterized protein (DUF697 family)
VKKYLLLTNSHDGKSMVRARLTPIRVVCNNTLSAALDGAEQEVRIRHTPSAVDRLAQAHKLLGLTNSLYQELDIIFNRMNSKRITERQLIQFVTELVPDNEDATFNTRTENIRSKILELNETGAALIPVPVADAVMITGIQVGMLVAISAVYGKVITKDTAKGLLLSYAAAQAGMWAASLLKAIPGVGTGAGMAIGAAVAGTFTVSLGVTFKAMARSNSPLTKEALEKARKDPAVKAEAARLVAEHKETLEKTKQLKTSISFSAVPSSFVEQVAFSFNAKDLPGSKKLQIFLKAFISHISTSTD